MEAPEHSAALQGGGVRSGGGVWWGGAVGGLTSCGHQVPEGATVALVPCLTKHVLRENQDYVPGESECHPPTPALTASALVLPRPQ